MINSFVYERLTGQIEMANKDKLAVIGINHKTSTVEQREKYQISRKEVPDALKEITSYEEVTEAALVATCNRMELYMVIDVKTRPADILNRFFHSRDIEISDEDKFYTHEAKEATRHLFRVISGLDSLVIGEYQIQGQVKEAYSLSCSAKTVDRILHRLFHGAFRAGKNVRSNTCMGACRQSAGGVAAKIMTENLGPTDTIAIVGVNENSRIMASALSEAGFDKFIFVNRTFYKAEELAHTYGGQAMGLSEIEKALASSNAVFASTGAKGFIVNKEMIHRLAVQERCPRLIVDMAVPRDIDTAGLPENIKAYTINDLQHFLDEERQKAMMDIPLAEEIIVAEARLFDAWADSRNNKMLEPYAEKFEMIRQQLFEEYKSQLPTESISKVDKMTRSLVHRMQSTFIRALIQQQKG